jgi:RHS repeat-associated protein
MPSTRYVVAWLALVLGVWAMPARAERPPALSAQTLKAPDGPTSLKGLGESFEANTGTGTGSYTVPLQLPPGFVVPALTLSYTGGQGRSELGVGFALPLLQIYRLTDKGAPSFTENDRFAVSGPELNEELVAVDAQAGVYRVKNEGADTLLRRDAAADSWTIYFADGSKAVLGPTLGARAQAAGKTTRWYVEVRADVHGHEARYRYVKDSGRVYCKGIDYQVEASAGYRNRVELEYETRPDVTRDYRYGEAELTTLRLSRVDVYQGARRLRRYTLGYEAEGLFSLLSKVEMEGEAGLRLPTLSLGYLQPSSRRGRLVRMSGYRTLTGLDTGRMTFEDVNGDGLPDLVNGVASKYEYFENIDGVRFSTNAVALSAGASPDRNLDDPGVVYADIDGDGFRDVWQPGNNGQFRFFAGGNVKDGVFRGYAAARVVSGNATISDVTRPEVRLADLNGDGRTDFLVQRLGLGDVWLENQTTQLVQRNAPALPVGLSLSDANLELVEFNGDGVPDLVLKEFDLGKSDLKVWFGLGSGKFASAPVTWNAPAAAPREVFLTDVNGDAQLDLVRVSGSHVVYYLNDGRGAFLVEHGSFGGLPESSATQQILLADMNGNGTSDVVWVGQGGAIDYLELSSEANAGLLSRIDNGMGLVTDISYRSSTDYMIEAQLRGAPWKTSLPHAVPVIAEVATRDSLDVLGAEPWESRVTYEYRDGFYDGREREFRGFGQVSMTRQGDESQEARITELRMHLGRNFTTMADEEGLKGKVFLKLVKGGDGALLSSEETAWELRWLCREDLPAGTPGVLPPCSTIADKPANKDKLVTTALPGMVLSAAWERQATPRYSASRVTYDIWGKATRVEDFGEVTLPGGHQLGQPFVYADLVTTVGEDERVTETDYARAVELATGLWRLGVPSEQRLKTISGVAASVTRNYYDGPALVGLPLGQVNKGLLSRRDAWLAEESRWVPVERTAYNTDGLPEQRMDATGYATSLVYDTEARLLPVQERLPLENGRSAVFSATYDRGFGVMTSLQDPNGHVTRYRYDGLARLERVFDSLASDAEPLIDYQYGYGSPEHPVSTTTIRQLSERGKATYRTRIEYTDAAGRLRLVKNLRGSDYVASGWKSLSSTGSVRRSFDAFTSTTAEFEAPPLDTPSATTKFDAVDRVLQECLPATASQPASCREQRYLPFETRSYDERDSTEGTFRFPTVERTDGLGRARRIERSNVKGSGVVASTWTMSYDVRGKLVSLDDPKGYRRSYGYDSLGRMTSLSDPNLGPISYRYDDAERPVLRTDALGQEQASEYGSSGRLLRQVLRVPGAGGSLRTEAEYSFHYDEPKADGPLSAAQNLLGRLSYVDYPVGSDYYSYDAEGRLVAQAAQLWDGGSDLSAQVRTTHLRSVSFDPTGAEISRALPGGFSVATSYDRLGLTRKVVAGLAADSKTVVDDARYDARGLFTGADHGNGLRSCRSYDSRQQLTGIVVGKSSELACAAEAQSRPSFGLYHVAYQWDYDRTLATVTDRSASKPGLPRLDASYEYDRLLQLRKATTSYGTWSYDYDEVQNLISKTVQQGSASPTVTALIYGEAAGPNAVTHLGTSKLSYDGLGMLKSFNGFDLRFDVMGRLSEATKAGGKRFQYFYDPFGERRVVLSGTASAKPEVLRYPLPGYELRGNDEVWSSTGPGVSVEVRRAAGLRVDAGLLDDLTAYVAAPQSAGKPLPAEWLDLDNDGDGFDAGDLAEARAAFWAGRVAGSPRTEWRWTHSDHLSSTVLTTDRAGDVVSERRYEPYGSTSRRAGAQTTRGYTGSEIDPDEELGLIRLGARYYAPALSRFVTPDRYIGESALNMIKDPLQSNLYSYASNNPISILDPTGTESVEYSRTDTKRVQRLSQFACWTGDRNALRIARYGQMKWGGLGQKMLDHYLSGKGGTVEVDLKRMLAGDELMRATLQTQIVSSVMEEVSAGYSGGQINGSAFISQSDYSNEDNQMALGGTYVYWNVDSSPEAREENKKTGKTRIVVELMDVYFWSPHDPRATQCLHVAAEKLKTSGAKEFKQHGLTTISVALSDDKVFKPTDGEIKVRRGTTVTEP